MRFRLEKPAVGGGRSPPIASRLSAWGSGYSCRAGVLAVVPTTFYPGENQIGGRRRDVSVGAITGAPLSPVVCGQPTGAFGSANVAGSHVASRTTSTVRGRYLTRAHRKVAFAILFESDDARKRPGWKFVTALNAGVYS